MGRIVIAAAVVALLAGSAAGAQPAAHRVDLATGVLDGHDVLDRTRAQVVAMLGRPDFKVGEGNLLQRIGWGTPGNFSLELLFRRSHGLQRVQTIVFERGTVIDPKVGNVLRLRPARLQSAIRSGYGNAFELIRPFGCTHAECIGEFTPAPGGGVAITFGSTKTRGTFVTVWRSG
jgi:hypothetical protein